MLRRPHELTPRNWGTPLALILSGSLAFILIVCDLHYHGQLQQADHPLQIYFHQHSAPALILLFSAISGLGELLVILTLALVVGSVLAVKKKWRSLTLWLLALAGSGIINPALKNFFQIPRPNAFTFYIFKTDSGYSFPSGHTMAVAITAGALALVLLHNFPTTPAKRWLAALLVALLSLLEAFALMYIGVHYLTDVLAALAVSTAWLGIIRALLPPAKLNP